ncbi:MAG: hypothetical protein PHN84_15545 [Desulfuromonadaceae bacterium]|nr:hypothetical protein [Desulfuromonadaceae bacterium]
MSQLKHPIKKSASEANPTVKKNLTETEASAEYGYSVHWYRRARWAGNGPRYIKIRGGGVLYPRAELDAFFDSRLVGSTSESTARRD